MLSIIQSGRTDLMEASGRGYADTVRVLLEAKADPNITNEVNHQRQVIRIAENIFDATWVE